MQIPPIIVSDFSLSRAREAPQQVVAFEFVDLVAHDHERVHIIPGEPH